MHRSKKKFKFELVAKFGDDRGRRKLLVPIKWTKDVRYRVDESLKCTENDLVDFPEEKHICLRKWHREKELESTGGRLNLYDVLGLDMENLRKMAIDDLKKSIEKGFREKIRIWHPDKNFGDDEIAKQIIVAREILLDDERRARYHNEADYDKGWLSPRRYRAVFWPECFTEEQNRAYWRRVAMIAASFGITICGFVLSLSTSGAATPLVVTGGSILGTGLVAAGLQSLEHAVNKDSVVNECDSKAWLSKGMTGFVGGAITAGATASITAGVATLGGTALKLAAVTMGGNVGIGSATGAISGATSSLVTDATNDNDVTTKQMICHAMSRAVVGATAGALSGLVTQGVMNHQASAEVGKQVAMQTGAKRVADALALDVSREVTESGTKAVLGTATNFVEERLDDSIENQHPMKHLASAVKEVSVSAIKAVVKQGSTAVVSEAKTQFNLKRNELANESTSVTGKCTSSGDTKQNDSMNDVKMTELSITFEPNNIDKSPKQNSYLRETNDNEEETRDVESKAADEQSQATTSKELQVHDNSPTKVKWLCEESEDHDPNEGVIKFESRGTSFLDIAVTYNSQKYSKCKQDGSCKTDNILFPPIWGDANKSKFESVEMNNSPQAMYQSTNATSNKAENDELITTTDSEKQEGYEWSTATIKYISEIPLVSKMIVTYSINSKECKREAKGSGEKVTVPLEASQVKVRFQLRRFGVWWDIVKYDRFKEAWCYLREAHVFQYERPMNRTFTLGGNVFGFGAVMRVSNEYHDETHEI